MSLTSNVYISTIVGSGVLFFTSDNQGNKTINLTELRQRAEKLKFIPIASCTRQGLIELKESGKRSIFAIKYRHAAIIKHCQEVISVPTVPLYLTLRKPERPCKLKITQGRIGQYVKQFYLRKVRRLAKYIST